MPHPSLVESLISDLSVSVKDQTLIAPVSCRGRFSVVKRCLDAKTKKPYAAKIIKYDDDTDRDDALQEFDIHRSIKGDKVVMLRDAFLVQRYLVLIMDL